jgi:hypothetical protein
MKSVRVRLKLLTRTKEFKRTLRAGQLVQRVIIRNSVYSMGPTALNDVLIHHAHLDLNEIKRIATDTATIDGMIMLAIALSKLV